MMPTSEAAKIVADSIARGKTTRDGAGESRAALACRYYDSVTDQIADMTAHYSTLYKPSSTWHTTRPKSAYNITKAITDELGQLYNRPVKRTFNKPAEAAMWAEIEGGFSPLMANIDRYTFLSGMVAARPLVMPGGSFRWVYYTRDQIEFVPDALDPTAPHWLVVSFRHGDCTIKHWWSATHYVRTVDDVVSYTEDEATAYPGGVHQYERIPLVIFRNDVAGRAFFGEPASDLVNANREINFQASRMNWTMVWQGASVMVMTGGDESKLLEIDPSCRIALPKDATLSYASPDPAIDNTVAAVNLNLMLLCKSRRIPDAAFLLERQGESGVAIVARQAGLEDYRQARGELFRPMEQELIVLSLQVYALHTGKAARMIEIEPPSISYEKPMRPMSADVLAELTIKKQWNLVTAADILVAQGDAPTREEAQAIIDANREQNAKDAGAAAQEIKFKNKSDAPDDSDAPAAAADAGSVQATALNGAQVTALQGIMASVSDNTLSREAAKILIALAFPLFSADEIEAMVNATRPAKAAPDGE